MGNEREGCGETMMARIIHPCGGGWQKYSMNPVLGEGIGTCFDPFVLPYRDGYRMFFSWRPQRSLAVADSSDGWHWGQPQIILPPDPAVPGEEETNRACILREGTVWKIWFTSQYRPGKPDGTSRIFYAESGDGLVWNRHPRPVLIPSLPWEKAAVMCPHVTAEDGRYRMWYSGGEQYEPDAIGYAESGDGIHWHKREEPVFTADPMTESERHKVTACHVVKISGWYVMFYIGFEDEDTARVHLARSRDGIGGWQRHPDNPILSPGDGFDRSACYKPCALPVGGGWMLWYNGRNGPLEMIGAAYHQGLDLGFGPPADVPAGDGAEARR